MSKGSFFSLAVVLLVLFLPPVALAGDFDGSKSLSCAAVYSVECEAGDQTCITGAPWMINFPIFMDIDFKGEKVTTARTLETPRVSPINHIGKLQDGDLALQGIDGNYAWSMVIEEDTGALTLTISGEYTGYMVFGACQVR